MATGKFKITHMAYILFLLDSVVLAKFPTKNSNLNKNLIVPFDVRKRRCLSHSSTVPMRASQKTPFAVHLVCIALSICVQMMAGAPAALLPGLVSGGYRKGPRGLPDIGTGGFLLPPPF